ncbi:9355_t:CDS:2 [Ambispora gerdemannii]|uniref:9355_t:CDS:1 n=1 Tax=Ambispora gerdemannii TaxID=144530 RepID=A0A9N9C3G8_9GLOM|nr:9355_t:CDS:2 [Ambispora gerdemannii]
MLENRGLEIEDSISEESGDELDPVILQPEFLPETRIIHKKCFDCRKFMTNFAWCQPCETTWFKENYSRWTTGSSVADTFGISKDTDGCFIFVMRFYENGDLNQYIENVKDISWNDKIDLLWGISAGLENIHRSDLYHGNLHGGNVMIEDESISTDGRIADIGIHGLVNVTSNKSYGVIPYIAPEILLGETQSKEADIYSFSVIMWSLAAGKKPFAERAHDIALTVDICNGVRPKEIENIPKCFSDLMKRCWAFNPKQRPTAIELNTTFSNWITDICDNQTPTGINEEFSIAEERRSENFQIQKNASQETHKDAFYTSRFFDFSELRENLNIPILHYNDV